MNATELRKKLGLNQVAFWSRLGVTQSGGSRYEAGRNVPKPVQKLLTMAFAPKAEALRRFNELRGSDVRPASYFIVKAGDHVVGEESTTTFTSDKLDSFESALMTYGIQRDMTDWAEIEFHTENQVYSLHPKRIPVPAVGG
jgi:transcriptional regulator with XRE-family HTH domain